MNKFIITHKGVMVNPASATLLPTTVAESLRKRLEPEKGEAPSGELEASGTEEPCKETFDAPIVAQFLPSAKTFSTLQAQAARAGHELTQTRHETGLMLWQVARWGQTRQFSEWGEVCAFVAQIVGGARHA